MNKNNWKFLNVEGSNVHIIPFKDMLLKFKNGSTVVGYMTKTGQWSMNTPSGYDIVLTDSPVAIKELGD